MSNHIINVQGLIKRYGKVMAVTDVTFSVEKGEIYGLLGPNGAGKTTTLECIEGLRENNGGNISVDGINPHKNQKEIRNKLGIQLQSSSLPSAILVNEAVNLFCSFHHTAFRSDLVNRFGLGNLQNKQYHSLSTGQKRRLHLALALVNNPQVVILDEPTAGLDVEGRARLHDEIRLLKKQNVTMLLATHDMAEAEELCDHISIIMKGKVAVTGTPSEVTAAGKQNAKVEIRTENRTLFNCNFNNAEFQGESNGYCVWLSKNTASLMDELLKKAKENNDTVLDIRVDRPSLEESFLEIVSGGQKQ